MGKHLLEHCDIKNGKCLDCDWVSGKFNGRLEKVGLQNFQTNLPNTKRTRIQKSSMNWWRILAHISTKTTWSKPKIYPTECLHHDQASGSVLNHCVASNAISSKMTLKVFKNTWKSVSTIQKRDSSYATVRQSSVIVQCFIIISICSNVCAISAPASWSHRHQLPT